MTDIAISVDMLSKAYRLGEKEEIPDTLMSAMTGWMTSPVRNFKRLRKLNTFGIEADGPSKDDSLLWALKDVSFDVRSGQVVGIVGRNGAGKSTLLKVLARITEPTSGRAVIKGRVGSLLEVGTGFHPELTGRENVYMNGTVLGMTKREIDQKFDEIVDFAGVERFLDTPIKRYSSGMQVRLAFAVAANLEPEILIVDEVLAVGDAEFQRKCLNKMSQISIGGRTILFVSHNLSAVNRICSDAILMSGGQVRRVGSTADVTAEYLQQFDDVKNNVVLSMDENAPIVLRSVNVAVSEKPPHLPFDVGDDIEVSIDYEVREPTPGAHIAILVNRDNMTMIRTWDTDSDSTLSQSRPKGTYRARLTIPGHVLGPGRYTIGLNLAQNRESIFRSPECVSFDLHELAIDAARNSSTVQGALLSLPLNWTLEVS